MIRLFNVETGLFIGPIFQKFEQLNAYVEKNIWPEDKHQYKVRIYTLTREIPLDTNTPTVYNNSIAKR